MTTLTGTSTRTITGYVVTLLEFPRWLIARDVDFTACHLRGEYDADDGICTRCEFGSACRWLSTNRQPPTMDTPLADLVDALRTAADYVRRKRGSGELHDRDCECDTCQWLHDASNFLRAHRHRT
jgi:hypothetical protein